MHRRLARWVFVGVALVGIVFAITRPPKYTAQSLIYIQPATPKPVTDVTSGLYDSSRYDSYIQQQLQTIVRDDILAGALKRLPAGMWQKQGESEQSAVTRLRAALKVERMLSSYEVRISLEGRDPATVTRVVNEVTSAFLRLGRSDEMAQSEQQLQLLLAERQRVLGDLTRDREEQARLSSSLGVADTSSETTGNPYDVQLEDLRQQVAKAREDHDVAQAQLAAVSKGAGSSEMLDAVSDEVASSDVGLSALKTSITQRRSALTAQMAGMTPTNPLYKQDENELARLDESLANLSQKLRGKASQQLVGKWKLEVARTGAVLWRLQSELAQQTSVATSAAPKLQRASDITADIARLQARFTDTDAAIHGLELQQNSTGLAHLSLAATEPQSSTASRRIVLLALAFPLALLCAALAAVVRHKLDQRVYIAADVDNVLRFPPMAVLPAPDDVETPVMNEFLLRLVAGIDQAHRVSSANTFVFTPASPGMDTSALVATLAKKMESMGYKVMVTRASAALNSLPLLESKQAIAEEPLPSADKPDAALATVAQDTLPAQNQSQKQVTRKFDMLFIDAKPILSSAEAEFDARLVDVTILLAESGSTTRRELTSSLALVRRLTSRGVAAVLTNLRLQHADRDFLVAARGAAVL
jgi:uncharacterized protein involved in exopolysaccharide biosynthesis